MKTATASTSDLSGCSTRPLRLGFAGVGWIGLNRLQAACQLDHVEPVALFDPSQSALVEAQKAAPAAITAATFGDLLELELDAVVVATPSALHAEQSITALRSGLAVFCQKPLARTYDETLAVLDAARAADRLLMTDLSYRYIRGVERMHEEIRSGTLGDVFAIDLTFHNAYGPDKPWFFDYKQSGGGCLIDLGTHLIDLALHLADARPGESLESSLFRLGRRLEAPINEVEDFASVTWSTDRGQSVRLACSWNLAAGCDAVIEATFYGTRGAVALRNENGSFVNFETARFAGTRREAIAEPDRNWSWGGGAICDFIRRLGEGERYCSDAETLLDVASILDRSYGR